MGSQIVDITDVGRRLIARKPSTGVSKMTTTTPTTAVDQVKSAFDFSVDKFPLRGPDSMSTPWYGLFDSNGEPVGPRSVSQVYVPHTTDDVVALVEASADAFGSELTARCHFNYGHFVELAPSKDFRRSVFGTADNIFPRVVIRAGYDGRAFSATVGYWRDACNNMAMLRQVDGATVSIRHTSGLRDEMDDLIQTFQRLRGSWDNVADVVANLENRRVRLDAFLTSVYGELADDAPPRTVNSHRRRTESIMRRVMRERLKTGRPDVGGAFMVSAWEAFNAVQGYTQHDKNRRGEPSDLSRALLASNDASVKRAESLVLAELVA